MTGYRHVDLGPEPEIPPGECAYGCGRPVMPGGDLCEDCAEMRAEGEARYAKSEQRKEAREANARRLVALPPCDCASPTLAGCAIHTTDWHSMPKTRQRTIYREMSARCVRYRQSRAERQQQQAEEQRRRDEERRQQRQALEQHQADLRAVTLIEPIPALAAMRETVLSERHDRCPKWRFRLAPDFVVQIQPRPGERRDRFFLFACTALRGAGIARDHFASMKAREGIGIGAVEFGVLAEDGRWRLSVTGWSGLPGGYDDLLALRLGLRGDHTELYARRLELMALVVEHLPRLTGLNADHMFEPACLCCGRELTDPASMARMIGPECAGTSSLNVGLMTLRDAASASDHV